MSKVPFIRRPNELSAPSMGQKVGFLIFGGPLFFGAQIFFSLKYQWSVFLQIDDEPCSPWNFVNHDDDCSNILMWQVQTGVYVFLFFGTLFTWMKMSTEKSCKEWITFPSCFFIVLMVAEAISIIRFQRIISVYQLVIDLCGYPQWILHSYNLNVLWNATPCMKYLKSTLLLIAILVLIIMIGLTDVQLQADQGVGRMLVGVEANLLFALLMSLAPGVRHVVEINPAPFFFNLSRISGGLACTIIATSVAAGISYTASAFSPCTRWNWDFERCPALAFAWSIQTGFAAFAFLLFCSCGVTSFSLLQDYAELATYLSFLLILLLLNIFHGVGQSPALAVLVVLAANLFTFMNLLLSTIVGLEAARVQGEANQSIEYVANVKMALGLFGFVWIACLLLYIFDVFTNSRELQGLILMISVSRSVLELVVCLYFPYLLFQLKFPANDNDDSVAEPPERAGSLSISR